MKRCLFIPQIRKIEAERTRLIPEIGKIEAKKTNWIEVKRTEAVFLKFLRSPGIDSKELIPPAYALAGLYNNPIPTWFLAPLDCSIVPAPCWYLKESMGTRNRVGIGLLYRLARLNRLAELIPRN